jgi:hypothetical protein
VDRRKAAELFHLVDGEVADADGPNLSLLVERAHRLRGFFDRGERVWPVDLVDIDVIGSKPL